MICLDKLSLVFALAIVMTLSLVPVRAPAAEAAARVDVNSAYVWRGITYNDGLVVQPSLDVGATSNLSINVWGNLNVDDYDGSYKKNEFSEVDLTVTYSLSAGPIGMKVSYAEYLYPHLTDTNGAAVAGTREVSLSVAMPVIPGTEIPIVKGIAIQAKACYDMDEIDGFYGALGLAYSMTFLDEDKLSAEIAASAGCADKKWAVANSGGIQGGLHEYNVTVSATYAAMGNAKLGATVGYTGTLDEDVLPEQDVDLYGGVSISMGF